VGLCDWEMSNAKSCQVVGESTGIVEQLPRNRERSDPSVEKRSGLPRPMKLLSLSASHPYHKIKIGGHVCKRRVG
jgi:hypothetical protein